MRLTRGMNKRSGIYRAKCCGYEIVLDKGELYPPCKPCNAPASWELAKPLVLVGTRIGDRQDTP